MVATSKPSRAQSLHAFTISGPGVTTDTICPAQFANCYLLTLGAVDALGITSSATFSKIASTSPLGELFISNATMYIMVGNSFNGQPTTVTAAATTTFAHPALLTGESCNSGCSVPGGYAAFSTATTTIYSGLEGPSIALNIGALVRELNGVSAFTGSDTEVLTLTAASGNHTAQDRLTINLGPVQTALSVKFTTSPTWASGSSTDYVFNFGNVNGLGVSSGGGAANCTVLLCPSAALPAVIYYSPQYTFSPAFSNFSSSTGSLNASLTTPFSSSSARSTLILCGASTLTSPCAPFPLTVSSIGDRGSIPQYLGLIVAESNGANAFTGTTNATITFTFTVP